MKHSCLLFLAAAACLLAPSCKRTPPANVAAVVNNHAITYDELEKTYKSQFSEPSKDSSEDETTMQKLDLLNGLINSEILLQRAEKLGLTAVDADVDTEFNKMKAPYTKEEFEQQLKARNMTVDDLRSQLRRDLTIQKLINKEITSHITITDADVANFYNANKASFNYVEPQLHIAQILTTPNPNSTVRNLKNSKAQNDTEARQKILDIEARLKRGEDFTMLAQNYSEDPNSAPNGGDMGYIGESALENVSPELRKVVNSLQPGAISQIIHTEDGYRILKMIEREPAGQRELNDPRVQQRIRDTLRNRKDQLLKAAYYEVARNSAKVENYLAQRVLANAGKSE
ncbi:MAG TPA: peptidylprolyl isomerase [Bryobacteraceae bacterium]|nr:peptidylprolyl isomerase [Bryobacteraceae bacterium]